MDLTTSSGCSQHMKGSGSSGRGIGQRTSETESPPRISQAALYELIVKQEFRCAVTGRHLDPSTATLDHIVPLSADVSGHHMNNVQIVHVDINRMKGVLSQDEFIAICREVVAHADKQ